MAGTYDVEALRGLFPALRRERNGRLPAFLDGPAGTQVPASVIEAISQAQAAGLSYPGGGFTSSRAADEIVAGARGAAADLFGAAPEEIVLGPNMTTLTLGLSRALAREWGPGDEVVVTLLDHDGNVTPWRLAAEDRGATVRTVPFDRVTGQLDMVAMREAITPATRLVAFPHASNALGTIPEVGEIVRLAHAVGALAFVDAVHYTPHGTIDVAALGCDFLVSSAYKFFGPHVGALYGRPEHLNRIEPYKLVPAPDTAPDRWETGAKAFELLPGLTAAVDHMASLGEGSDRRESLISAQARVAEYEAGLADRFLAGAAEIPGLTIHGITGGALLGRRVPTFAVGLAGRSPRETADRLAEREIYVWAGHYYAVGVMRHLGLLKSGGLVRIGFVQYSTSDEVDRVLGELGELAAG
jgi:cysteine desulfurase family protein (TIGR01976 family)